MTLPFRQWATVTDAGDTVQGTTRLSIWKLAEPRQTPTGEVVDWSGEAEITAASLLIDKTNRRVYVVDEKAELEPEAETQPGRRFTVVAAVRHDFLPHLELKLREIRGG